jgi:hypothetical protein
VVAWGGPPSREDVGDRGWNLLFHGVDDGEVWQVSSRDEMVHENAGEFGVIPFTPFSVLICTGVEMYTQECISCMSTNIGRNDIVRLRGS